MTSKFEQLIEYVINDEEAKAKELFHDIVVEKSREIYENLMSEEELDEAESTDKEDKKAEKAGEKVTKDIEYDDKEDRKERMDEEEDEEMDESMHGMMDDQDPIDEVEAEEQGMEMQEGEGEEDLEDRVVDLEDKLDELMAEFESLMGDEAGEGSDDEMDGEEEIDVELDSDEGGDALEMDDTEEFQSEPMPMEEAVNLQAAPKPVTSEESGINTKGPIASNSGAKGAVASPVKMTGDTAHGRSAPKAGELIGKVQNSVGGDKKLSPATKPHLAQATGVNTKTPFPKA
jgi:hypothetical protein